MVLLPYLDGFFRTGEKVDHDAIFICSQCQSKRTVKAGKTIPKCSKCGEHTYWYKAVSL